jgi:catalase
MTKTRRELGGPERVKRLMFVMENYLGFVPGFRRAHARGVGFRGEFTATPQACALTTAEHMQGETVEAVVRLSNGSGNPYFVDRTSSAKGSVLGLAVRFELPSGGHTAWAALNITTFPARKPDDFIGLSSARRKALPGGLPNPLRFLAFLALHPQCVPGLRQILGVATTQSFATAGFNGLHAYYAVDADGRRQPFRYRWSPAAGIAGMSEQDDRLLPPQYLVSEIKQRVAREPVAWDLVFQLGEPGDPVDDLTKLWPNERRQIRIGRLVVNRLHEDQDHVDGLVFDPTVVPPGIELSDDPVLHFRSESYAESHHRRSSETKPAIRAE